MRIGFQTILFGNYIYDLDTTLETIAQAGFEGVKFFSNHKIFNAAFLRPINLSL